LMVGSGVVKLMGGDPTWRDLTALSFHFETQPLPNPPAWYAHQLALELLKVCTVGMFAIELVVPLLFLGPRRLRAFASVPLIGLQAVLAFTGNFAFFNLLTATLCVFLLDDETLGDWGRIAIPRGRTSPVRRTLLVIVAIVTIPVSTYAFCRRSFGTEVPG